MDASRRGSGARAPGTVESKQRERPSGTRYRKLRPGPGRSAEEVSAHQRARLRAALVELVSERGYNAVTVRDLVQRAGVSKRDCYRHFGGKEECFLTTYDLIVRNSVRGILASTADEDGWCERLQVGFQTFARQLADNPQPARLALVEAFDAGPAALERMQYTSGLFEALVEKSLSDAAGDVQLPPLVVKGIVAGAARVARARLLTGREHELSMDGDKLLEWALSFCDEAAMGVSALDGPGPARTAAPRGADLPPEGGDRALILAAAARLAAETGYHELTVPRIRAAAGVSRRSFHAHFEGVTDCFLSAVDLLGARALAEAMPAYATADDWAGGVHQVIAALCRRLSRDPLLARLAFLEVFAPGSESVRWRGDLIGKLAALLRHDAEPDQRPTDFAAEASIGAIWGVIHHFVATGRNANLPAAAATLSYLALAPAIGSSPAYQAIATETERTASPASSVPGPAPSI
jgi:AcrR family transcriptional regulator